MRAQTIIIAAIVFSLCCAGLMNFVFQMTNDYGITFSGTSLDKLNKINDTYDFTMSMGQEIQQGSNEVQQEGTNPLSTADKLWNGIKYLFNSLTTIPAMISTAADVLEIPQYIIYAFLSIVVLTLVISLVVLLTGLVERVL